MPLPLTVSCFSKIQIGFTFWYRLTWVVPNKGPLNRCVCVCVCSTTTFSFCLTSLFWSHFRMWQAPPKELSKTSMLDLFAAGLKFVRPACQVKVTKWLDSGRCRLISVAHVWTQQQTHCTSLLLSIDGIDRQSLDHFKMLTAYYVDRVISGEGYHTLDALSAIQIHH